MKDAQHDMPPTSSEEGTTEPTEKLHLQESFYSDYSEQIYVSPEAQKKLQQKQKLQEYLDHSKQEKYAAEMKLHDSLKKQIQAKQHLEEKLNHANQKYAALAADYKKLKEILLKTKHLAAHRGFESEVLTKDNHKLKKQLQLANARVTHMTHERNRLSQKIVVVLRRFKDAISLIKKQKQIIADIKQEHHSSMEKAGSLINEYFHYKFIESPPKPTPGTPGANTLSNEEFLNQLKFLEKMSESK